MTTSLVRSDNRSLYVRTGGYVFRPGAVRAYYHALRMDDAGLVAGDRVKAQHKGGTPLARIVMIDGTTTYWCEEETAAKAGVQPPHGATWLPDGSRDMSCLYVDENGTVIPGKSRHSTARPSRR